MKEITTEIHSNKTVWFSYQQGDAPYLKSVNGGAMFACWTGAAPSLLKISGGIDALDWTGNAPKLKFVGGDYHDNNWSRIKQIHKQCTK